MWAEIAAEGFAWSYRVFRLIHGGIAALFEGFWMGVLPESALDLISEGSYGDGAAYTNARWLDSGLQFWEDLAVRRFFDPETAAQSRICVAAAGGGREVIALARMGFSVDGFDCSRRMVAAGVAALAERKIAAKFEWAAPCDAPPATEIYTGVIVGWNGYTYIAPRERRINFLKKMRARVNPGAPALVSVAIRTPGRIAQWTARIANVVRVCTFRRPVFEAGTGFQLRPRVEFTRAQLEQEMSEAGFAPQAFYKWGGFGAVVCLAVEVSASPVPRREIGQTVAKQAPPAAK
jgi:hypothetical protein